MAGRDGLVKTLFNTRLALCVLQLKTGQRVKCHDKEFKVTGSSLLMTDIQGSDVNGQTGMLTLLKMLLAVNSCWNRQWTTCREQAW